MQNIYQIKKDQTLAEYNKMEQLTDKLNANASEIDRLSDEPNSNPLKGMESLVQSINEKVSKIENDRFCLMVAGESKSGKSTFINAYLGAEILPMDPKQCTSAIIEIKYGETFKVRATHADGTTEEIDGEEAARAYLKANAALDDDYREIPVPTINEEILVKSGRAAKDKGKYISISEADIKNMLNADEVLSANIYNLSPEEYEIKIREYINAKKDAWGNIVTKIEVFYPIADESMRGIEIIDSPGVCARGGVSDITMNYIRNADAIIFLKPLTGQAMESTHFNNFMEAASLEHNKHALFLVFTWASNIPAADFIKLEEEARRQFSMLPPQNILFADSKAELYVRRFTETEDLSGELNSMCAAGTLDAFVVDTYAKTNGLLGSGDFLTALKEVSRFEQVAQALNSFGRKAHFVQLLTLTDSIDRYYDKILANYGFMINLYKQKTGGSPEDFQKDIRSLKMELSDLKDKMFSSVDELLRNYTMGEGKIRSRADNETRLFIEKVNGIDPSEDDCFSKLETYAADEIELFNNITRKFQTDFIAECDAKLADLSSVTDIPAISLVPDFNMAMFEIAKENAREKAYVDEIVEEGKCFKKTKIVSRYSQPKHFRIIKDNIINNIERTKERMVNNIRAGINVINNLYLNALKNNVDQLKKKIESAERSKVSAEEIYQIIALMEGLITEFEKAKENTVALAAEIEAYV